MTETTSTTGYGQQFPQDSDDEVNKIAFVVRQMMAQMATTRLVQVKAVHGGAGAVDKAGTVDVLPLVNQIDGSGNSTKHDTVYGIPWTRLQGGKNAIIVDPEVDDIGYVVCCDRDVSNVKASGGQANPGSFRTFDIADGIYVGGCLCVAPEQYLVFTLTGARLVDKNGNSVVLSDTGIKLTDLTGNVCEFSSSGITATPKTGLPFTVVGDLTVSGTITAGGLIISGTIHSSGALIVQSLTANDNIQSLFGNILANIGQVSGNTVLTNAGIGLASHIHFVPVAPGNSGVGAG